MSTDEVAEYLGVTTGRVRQLARAGKLKGKRVGRDWVFERPKVEAFASEPRKSGRPPQDE